MQGHFCFIKSPIFAFLPDIDMSATCCTKSKACSCRLYPDSKFRCFTRWRCSLWRLLNIWQRSELRYLVLILLLSICFIHSFFRFPYFLSIIYRVIFTKNKKTERKAPNLFQFEICKQLEIQFIRYLPVPQWSSFHWELTSRPNLDWGLLSLKKRACFFGFTKPLYLAKWARYKHSKLIPFFCFRTLYYWLDFIWIKY